MSHANLVVDGEKGGREVYVVLEQSSIGLQKLSAPNLCHLYCSTNWIYEQRIQTHQLMLCKTNTPKQP